MQTDILNEVYMSFCNRFVVIIWASTPGVLWLIVFINVYVGWSKKLKDIVFRNIHLW